MATEVLLKQFIDHNDGQAFAELTRCYGDMVYSVCLRILKDHARAADATQETFIQLLKSAKNVTGSLGAWLHRVATTKSIDLLRQEGQQNRLAEQQASSLPTGSSEWASVSLEVDEALQALDVEARELLIGYYLESRSMQALAESQGTSQPTVSRKLKQATERLREILGSRGVTVSVVVLAGLLKENVVQAAPAMVTRELGKLALAGQGTFATFSLGVVTQTIKGWCSQMLASKVIPILLVCTGVVAYMASNAGKGKGGAPYRPSITPPTTQQINYATLQTTLDSFEEGLRAGDVRAVNACFRQAAAVQIRNQVLDHLAPPMIVQKQENANATVRIEGSLQVRNPFRWTHGADTNQWQTGETFPFVMELQSVGGQWKIVSFEQRD